jgi:hypothetical protein
MVERATDYRWSSANAHCTGSQDPWLDLVTPPFEISDWRQWLNGECDEDADRFIRECTANGRPCGDETFVRQIEGATNRDFTRKKPGPKPKVQSEENSLLWNEDRIVR